MIYQRMTDPLFKSQWNLRLQNVSKAWELSRGEGVTIGVIDTGIDYTHKDLGGSGGLTLTALDTTAARKRKTRTALCRIRSETHPKIRPGWNYLEDSDDTFDNHRHGTAMSGIIAAEADGFGMVGVAPDSMIRAYKVLNAWGRGSQEDTAKAIMKAADDGCRVISMSLAWRTDAKPILIKAVEYALQKDVVLVAASGNHNREGIETPANLDGVLAIGGCDAHGSRWVHNDRRGSNYGDGLICIAPATAQHATRRMRSRFSMIDATSAATANVAGIAALMLSANDSLTQDDILRVITACADTDWNEYTGWGILDAYELVKACHGVPKVITPAERLRSIATELVSIAEILND